MLSLKKMKQLTKMKPYRSKLKNYKNKFQNTKKTQVITMLKIYRV